MEKYTQTHTHTHKAISLNTARSETSTFISIGCLIWIVRVYNEAFTLVFQENKKNFKKDNWESTAQMCHLRPIMGSSYSLINDGLIFVKVKQKVINVTQK